MGASAGRGAPVIARTAAVGLLLLTAAVLETALFPAITLAGFRPDLLLLVPLVIGTRDGALAGLRVGAVAGLLRDLLVSATPVGLGMFVAGILGALVGWSRPYLSPNSLSAPLLLPAGGSLLGTAALGVLGGLLVDDRPGAAAIVQATVAVTFYNTLLTPPVTALVRRLSDALPLRGAAAE